ncbi:MAG: copper amine oxidase N-terminal domain-containing protein [Fimbriimonas sp.]
MAQRGRARVPQREVRVYVRNERVRFDRVQPVLVGRRILIPLRGVFEKMGASVRYDARRKRVIASRGQTRVVMRLNSPTAVVNGERKLMDAWPRVSKGHVLVPIRFVGESLDAGVAYLRDRNTVRITPH